MNNKKLINQTTGNIDWTSIIKLSEELLARIPKSTDEYYAYNRFHNALLTKDTAYTALSVRKHRRQFSTALFYGCADEEIVNFMKDIVKL